MVRKTPWHEAARNLIALDAALKAQPEDAPHVPTWHVVTSQGPIILGVFGEALLAEAQACAAKIERQTGSRAFVQQVRGVRPCVGQSTLAWGVDGSLGARR